MSAVIADLLKNKRKQYGLSVKDVLKRLKDRGIEISDKTLYGWESGHRQPDADTFLVLCEIYKINTLSEIPDSSPDPITTAEQVHLNKLRALDAHGKDLVETVLEKEYIRAATTMEAASFNTKTMQVYDYPAAAGIPLYAENTFEFIEFPASSVPKGADFGIRISGDSMAPTIEDGTIVWVHKQHELQNGQIGIFMIDDSATCKRYYCDKDGLRLVSDNKKYDPIYVKHYQRFAIVGEVLGYR